MAHVLIVGGGVSGLAAAHRLRTTLGPDARLTVVEASRTLGASSPPSRSADDASTSAPRRSSPAARRPPTASPSSASPATSCTPRPPAHGCRRAGGPWRCPAHGDGVPADPSAAVGVLSSAGLAELEADRPGAWEPGGDVSVGALVRARVGDEVADRLVDPLLGGVYAGRVDELGVRATVPALASALTPSRAR